MFGRRDSKGERNLDWDDIFRIKKNVSTCVKMQYDSPMNILLLLLLRIWELNHRRLHIPLDRYIIRISHLRRILELLLWHFEAVADKYSSRLFKITLQ